MCQHAPAFVIHIYIYWWMKPTKTLRVYITKKVGTGQQSHVDWHWQRVGNRIDCYRDAQVGYCVVTLWPAWIKAHVQVLGFWHQIIEIQAPIVAWNQWSKIIANHANKCVSRICFMGLAEQHLHHLPWWEEVNTIYIYLIDLRHGEHTFVLRFS